MKVIINGTEQVFQSETTISAFMQSMHIDPRKVAIEKNLEIIPSSEYMDTYLADGDILEVVQFIGGG